MSCLHREPASFVVCRTRNRNAAVRPCATTFSAELDDGRFAEVLDVRGGSRCSTARPERGFLALLGQHRSFETRTTARAASETWEDLAFRWRTGEGDKQPVLFYPAKGDLAPLRVETLSYYGDTPPPGVTCPAGAEEDKKHILTFDLSPFPALVERFGHETMSLFVEAPNSGEFNDAAELIGSPKLSAIPEGGTPMDVGAIDLPEKLRKSGRSAEAEELRSVLQSVEAHAFGPAYWIQQNLGDSCTLQLNDSFINLGDCGSFYTGDFGTTWQCH